MVAVAVSARLVHLQAHPIVDLVVGQCDVVLVDSVPAVVGESRMNDLEAKDGGRK
jgi:hypothetical protein